MLFLIIATSTMLVLLDRSLRLGRLDSLQTETRHALFELRDRLRSDAIAGRIQDDRWFDFLDTTITRTIADLKRRTVWQLGVLILVHRDDREIQQAYEQLCGTIEQPGNEVVHDRFLAFVETMNGFLYQRHRSALGTIAAASRLADSVQRRNASLKEAASRMLVSSPETSTLLVHCGDCRPAKGLPLS